MRCPFGFCSAQKLLHVKLSLAVGAADHMAAPMAPSLTFTAGVEQLIEHLKAMVLLKPAVRCGDQRIDVGIRPSLAVGSALIRMRPMKGIKALVLSDLEDPSPQQQKAPGRWSSRGLSSGGGGEI